ncbi:MAG: hypothetical protein EP330_18295 [Deltaproteobacteria bacterium]|nr:MAG: hypothetical protein EP330_18295 [Deltaproteobacteria bacterium]
MRSFAFILLLAFTACSESDYSLGGVCVSEEDGFDIEAVSTLQDAAGYPDNRDAIVLSYDDSALGPEETWRVTHVELLAMVPEWVFDSYEGGDVLRVDIWDGDHPVGTGDWFVEQAIDPSSLQWERVTLSPDAFWAGTRNELDQRRAWMSFDFSDVIPETGMQSNSYTVGITWGSRGLPTIGYSNFNLACSANYTDYGDGTWTLNSADGDGDECSWPMMRIGVETRTEDDGECDGQTIVAQ